MKRPKFLTTLTRILITLTIFPSLIFLSIIDLVMSWPSIASAAIIICSLTLLGVIQFTVPTDSKKYGWEKK